MREDGERFVIPSYRDVLSAKKPGLLKREILLLSTNYGNYVTIQKKSPTQYEVAFSTEPGTLLGESVWHYFKKPPDLIYCEEVPNTNEAILVIVKSGSVYLDGSFPLDSIADELVVFQTQKNNFEIYLYGNVPISQHEEEGKFYFDESSVKSFTILDNPVYPKLPVIKQYQLQLVDVALRGQGIGVFPAKQVIFAGVLFFLGWLIYDFIIANKKEIVPVQFAAVVNPYNNYIRALNSPDPSNEIQILARNILLLYTMPGWQPISIVYSKGSLRASVKSGGTRTNALYEWATKNNATVELQSDGFYVTLDNSLPNRSAPDSIIKTQEIISNLIDRLSYVLTGNIISIGSKAAKGVYQETALTINFNQITPTTLSLVGEQFKNLPLVLNNTSISVVDNTLTGTIQITALGN